MFRYPYTERKSFFQRPLIVSIFFICITMILYLYVNGVFEPVQNKTHSEEIQNSMQLISENNHPETTKIKRLPQAIIIGTRKSGTRALLKFLELNPSIRAAHSEVHFFDKPQVYKRGLDWYRNQMPESFEGEVTIEKSPAYFVTPDVPEKVKAMNESIKLVVIFRDPVTRLISDYSQLIANRIESMKAEDEDDYGGGELKSTHNISNNLVEALWKEAEMNFKKYLLRADGGIEEQRRAVKVGMYPLYLERWRSLFPAKQFHFVSGETLISDPASELQKLERFLGFKPSIKSADFVFNQRKGFFCLASKYILEDGNSSRRNIKTQDETEQYHNNHSSLASCLCKTKGRRHVTVSEEIVRKLRKFYAPYNEYLYELTGFNFKWPDK